MRLYSKGEKKDTTGVGEAKHPAEYRTLVGQQNLLLPPGLKAEGLGRSLVNWFLLRPEYLQQCTAVPY